jgi:hypothetical protein
VRRALVLLLGLLPVACVIQSRYPGAWPGVEGGRIDVSGVYLGDGVRGDPFAAPTSLGRLLLDEALAPGRVFEIAQYGGDSLVVSARGGGRKVFSRARGTLDCAGAGVAVACGWHGFHEAGFTLAAARRTVRLALAIDGSLMAQDVEHAIGLLVVFPMAATVRSWHRFSPPRSEGTRDEP